MKQISLHKLKKLPPVRYEGGIPVFECFVDPRYPKSMCFKCPKCGKINCHGLANGHRAPGCWSCWPDGYFVELAHFAANQEE